MDQAQQLRNIVKLSSQRGKNASKVITVTSGKGGVGKSSSAVNLAIYLKKMGKRVIIFDADFGVANVEIMFGTVPKYNLRDLIYKGKNIKEIIAFGPEDIGFVSGGSGITELSNLNRNQIELLIRNLSELDELADYIIIDTGAGISDAVLEFVMISKEILLVITPEPTSLTDAYSLIKVLNRSHNFQSNDCMIRVISNRANSYQEGMNCYQKLDTVAKRFLNMNIHLLGVVPNDDNVSKAIIRQKPVSLLYPNSKASKAYEEISKRLANDIKEYPNKKGIAGMFNEILTSRIRR
ncbi:MinD/ParA family protein [Candidatus Galacturonibacter soehngenii]|uniref:MinD/ParA family protein n=1 Tax=Candidatus Galacturonatibacter soehngenii TaxID=2307010 RepID=A0A7V7UB80_9FIRM|nr:MinD/ParA family protein [Candidatus Galacturonibacter soehngenii]KAB1437690.1 MinD/ParA family protein [Candidatus Galacturonibacter soehngenii]MBA4686919.1 MinD/ParA family protein [Candidatus Galacturonibacter soehngenii]